jgi:hypothetical protein
MLFRGLCRIVKGRGQECPPESMGAAAGRKVERGVREGTLRGGRGGWGGATIFSARADHGVARARLPAPSRSRH